MKTCFAIGMLFDGRMSAIFSMMFVASVFILVARLSRKGIAADARIVHQACKPIRGRPGAKQSNARTKKMA